jgi:4-hydroxy-3-polyprenylbenzoate decarboxylase
MQANLGMYRIQLSGNDYLPDQEVGLHYQLPIVVLSSSN